MKTLTLRCEISGDGKLRLEVPCALPPGPVEVVLVVQPTADAASSQSPTPRTARSGLFLGKGPSGLDLDTVTGEMSEQWKAKLADLEP
jgi:hypothetical protein